MSKLIESRAEFQQLADERFEEAQGLLALGKWSGAYYLAGYAVELALKACIIKRLMATDAFPDKDLSRNCYTHDLENLVRTAGLDPTFDAAIRADVDLDSNWTMALKWSEQKRHHLVTKAEAADLINSIAEPKHGVLPWIKTHW